MHIHIYISYMIRIEHTRSLSEAQESAQLLGGADLVIEDFAPGTIEQLGLGLADLHEQNPATSLLSISHFGRGGPWSNRPANEFTLQAQSGCQINWHQPISRSADQPISRYQLIGWSLILADPG